MLLLSFLCFFACKEEQEVTPLQITNESFFVRNLNGAIIDSLEPGLLKSVHKNLLKNDRISDAENLFKTYNKETGKLFKTQNYIAKSQSSVAAAYNIYYDAYVATKGWMKDYELGQVAGTEMMGLRMEAFRINSNP